MKDSFRQSMGWLHTWAGLIFSWVLLFMFITGSLGYFDSEIDYWMQPERPFTSNQPVEQQLAFAQNYLAQHGKGAARWTIDLPTTRSTPHLLVTWSNTQSSHHSAKKHKVILDVENQGTIEHRETSGGQKLYRMHYALHYLPRDLSRKLIGVFTMLMLLALITGVIIHRRIFIDFFTYRPNKKIRSWIDIHNLLSVASLPFQIMITYSGLLFFFTLYMPLIVTGSYGLEDNAVTQFRNVLRPDVKISPSGIPAPIIDLRNVVRASEIDWGKDSVRGLVILEPGDANSVITVLRKKDHITRSDISKSFYARNGSPISQPTSSSPTSLKLIQGFLGLHEGLFANGLLRWLYFISGLLGSAMVATGLIIWSIKRQKKYAQAPYFGYRLVESLNIGSIAGLPVAIAGYFIANRLLPVDMANRAEWELHSLFILWLVMLIYPYFRDVKQAWLDECKIAAGLFLSLPILNFLTTDKHLIQTLYRGEWSLAGVDLTMLFVGLCFLFVAQCIKRHTQLSATVAI